MGLLLMLVMVCEIIVPDGRRRTASDTARAAQVLTGLLQFAELFMETRHSLTLEAESIWAT